MKEGHGVERGDGLHVISNNGSCELKIRRRIGMAKTKIWRDRNIPRKTEVRLVNTQIFSIFSYGAETWT
ncbi:unnamed protein product [Leptidea sinapis]|uniref:Uncharacterized protein n=1 Tax=Leptidea sinapis TaxID=189913 RepID=A0A5E4PUA8_9NEOP|nr:unnamed protein product [Leptidea sinapis]